jgi:hypothetical protein
MSSPGRQIRLLASAGALASGLLILVGGAFSADRTQSWRWQDPTTQDAGRELVATTRGSDHVVLAVTVDPLGHTLFVVSANGVKTQEAAAPSPSNGPLAAFVVGDGAPGEAIVGVARADVAHVLLRSADGAARELPLNGDGAFAVSDAASGAQLEALAADGSTIGRIELPSTTPTCGGVLEPCKAAAPLSADRTMSTLGSAVPLYAVLESQSHGRYVDDLTRLDPATLNPVGARLRIGSLGTGPGVGAIALSPDQGRLAVAGTRGGQIAIVDLGSLRVTRRINTRSGMNVRSLAWLDNDQLALVGQQMGGSYKQMVAGRWLIRVRLSRGSVVAMTLPNKAVLRYSQRAGSRLISVLAPNDFHDPHRTVVAIDADGRTFVVPVVLPAPRPELLEDLPVASADGSHLYFVRTGGQVVDLDIAAGKTQVHQVSTPADASASTPQVSTLSADALGNGLVVSGAFTLDRGGRRFVRNGVYRIDTTGWNATTLDRTSSSFLVYGYRVATFTNAPVLTVRLDPATGRIAPGAGVNVYDGASGQRIYHVFGTRSFNIVRLIDGYGHALRSRPGPGVPYGFLDDRFNSKTGAPDGQSRPPLNGLRLIYRGSPDIQEPGAAAIALASVRPAATARIRPAATARRPGYTISNRGRAVPSRGNRNLFEGHGYQLFLLGTAGGRAFYRIQLTPHYTCWGSGPGQTIGKIGTSACSALVGAYPLQLDDTVVQLRRGQTVPRYLHVAGIAVDQAASVALQDPAGATLKTARVENNLFSIPAPYPHGLSRIVALDANGKALPPHPDWGEHQTPPPDLFGPRTAKVAPAQLGTVVQRGEAKGVVVSADQEGVVLFDTRSMLAAARRALAGHQAWFACFQIDGQNVRRIRSGGISAPLAPVVSFKIKGLKPRYDGCEAGGSYGHHWHDQYGPHSTIEVPLTAHGNRYFEDRATARDLSEFVRSAKTQALRRKTGAQLKSAVRRVYGVEVSFLTSSSASAAPGRVGIWNRGSRTIFSERSQLGDRFYVEFDNGKLTHENVRGLAFVF